MTEQLFISGQLGKVIYEDGGRYFVMEIDSPEPQECRPMDFGTFFGFGAEMTILSSGKVNLASLREQLQTQTAAHHALRLIISGMDRELGLEIRAAAIAEAEEFLKEDQAHRFVRARLLSRPLLGSEDIVKAKELAVSSKSQATAKLYEDVLEASDYIPLVQKIWNETADDYFSTFGDHAKATQELTDLGTFADITSLIARKDFDALSFVVVTYAQKAELKGGLRPASVLLNEFRRRLVEHISLSSEIEKPDERLEFEDASDEEDVSIEAMLSSFEKRRDSRQSKIFTAEAAKKRVDRQIETISKLIAQGNVYLADRYLTDLVGFHVKHSQRKHLAMSLCSLAAFAIDSNAFVLSERLVTYALMLGIDDVVILNTQARLAKSLGDFEKALAIYEEAMIRFPNNEVARNGYAQVLKATGEFDRALAVFHETMTRFPNDVIALNGYAETLKATGEFDRALAVYKQTMTRFPKNVMASCGYAEVLKATGRFNRALEIYEETVTRSPNNEVARNGYAETLKATGEFDRALVVYEETMIRFPNSEVARDGYADVLKATGAFDRALAVYRETMTRFPNDVIARNGYAEILKATGELDRALTVYKETMTRFPNAVLARNGYARALKATGEVNKALAVYHETMIRFPNDVVARNGYAEILKATGEFERALAVYHETMTRFPNDVVARSGYAEVLKATGEIDRALAVYHETMVHSRMLW